MRQIPQMLKHKTTTTLADDNILDKIVSTENAHEDYELWHHRYGHLGERVMQRVGQMTKGTPKKWRRHRFFREK